MTRLVTIALAALAAVSTPSAAKAPVGYVNIAKQTPYANIAGWKISYGESSSTPSCAMSATDLGNPEVLFAQVNWDAETDRIVLVFAIKNNGSSKANYSSSLIVHLLDLDNAMELQRSSANWVMSSSTDTTNRDYFYVTGASSGGYRFLDAAQKSEAVALFRSKEEHIGTAMLKGIGAAVAALRQCAQSRVPMRDAK